VLYDLRPPGEDLSAPEKICDVVFGMDESIYPCIIEPLVYIGGGAGKTSNWQTCTEF
jgi:hypothetical protein